MTAFSAEPGDIQTVSIAVKELAPLPRQGRWGHLSLCILDATFSIALDYDSVVAPLVHRYAEYAQLSSVIIRGSELSRTISPRADEQTLSQFLASIAEITDEEFAAEVLGSRTLTSTTNGMLKSRAARRIAQVLVSEGIETLHDVSVLLDNLDRSKNVEKKLNAIKGSGTSGIRTGYIWMNAGDDFTVKPDRHILNWLRLILDRKITVPEARVILAGAASELSMTPWSVDHAIWEHMAR